MVPQAQAVGLQGDSESSHCTLASQVLSGDKVEEEGPEEAQFGEGLSGHVGFFFLFLFF